MAFLEEDLIDTMNAITSAFAGVSREGGVSLHETRVLDDCGSDAERAKARAKDTEINWQDVPDSDIEKPDLSLNFLDPVGFRYYIPAYMMWELRLILDERSVDCNTHCAAIFALTLDEKKDMQEWQMARFEAFTTQQLRAINRFLRFYTMYGDDDFQKNYAQEALDQYWSKWN